MPLTWVRARACVQEDASTGDILGFADVGLALFDTRRRSFRLPARPEGEPGFGLPSTSHLWCRPYLSNLAVDESQRRRGIGGLLVNACEEEARTWRAELGATGAVEAGIDSESGADGADEGVGGLYSDVWLEASLDNTAALLFYRRLGYEFFGENTGKEIVRRRWSFESETVRRGILRKALRAEEAPEGA